MRAVYCHDRSAGLPCDHYDVLQQVDIHFHAMAGETGIISFRQKGARTCICRAICQKYGKILWLHASKRLATDKNKLQPP